MLKSKDLKRDCKREALHYIRRDGTVGGDPHGTKSDALLGKVKKKKWPDGCE